MTQAAAYSRLAAVYDEIVVDPCYPQWAQFLHELWAVDATPVRDVLDVCCGTGLLAAELRSRGYAITGTDASEAMLDRARALLGAQATLLHVSLPEVGTTAIFDAVISTFDGLNYLTTELFQRSIAALADRLRPRGWLCFDLHTDAMLDFTSKNADVTGEEDGYRFVIHSDVAAGLRTCDTWIDVTDTRDNEHFSEHHRQYFHSDAVVMRALQSAGFTDITTVHEYTSAPADADTLRATWIARKKPIGVPA